MVQSRHLQGLCEICWSEHATIVCTECSGAKYCIKCDLEVHNANIIHDRMAFVGGLLHPITPLECVNEENNIVEFGM